MSLDAAKDYVLHGHEYNELVLYLFSISVGMLPLGMLNAARQQAILVEVKSGETFNGKLLACDVWMNMRLGDALRTSADGTRCHIMRELLVRGSAVKCIRLPENVIESAHEYNEKQAALRRARAAAEGRSGARDSGQRRGANAGRDGPSSSASRTGGIGARNSTGSTSARQDRSSGERRDGKKTSRPQSGSRT